jgi:hypothetical protein
MEKIKSEDLLIFYRNILKHLEGLPYKDVYVDIRNLNVLAENHIQLFEKEEI